LAERLHMALSPTPTSPPITPASDNHPSFQENTPSVQFSLLFIGRQKGVGVSDRIARINEGRCFPVHPLIGGNLPVISAPPCAYETENNFSVRK
jgi:hypothetical protein